MPAPPHYPFSQLCCLLLTLHVRQITAPRRNAEFCNLTITQRHDNTPLALTNRNHRDVTPCHLPRLCSVLLLACHPLRRRTKQPLIPVKICSRVHKYNSRLCPVLCQNAHDVSIQPTLHRAKPRLTISHHNDTFVRNGRFSMGRFLNLHIKLRTKVSCQSYLHSILLCTVWSPSVSSAHAIQSTLYLMLGPELGLTN